MSKLAADQIVFAPLFLLVATGVAGFMQEYKLSGVVKVIKRDFPDIIIATFKIWPAGNFINLYFFPLSYQLGFNSVIALGWNTYFCAKTYAPDKVADLAEASSEEVESKLDGETPSKRYARAGGRQSSGDRRCHLPSTRREEEEEELGRPTVRVLDMNFRHPRPFANAASKVAANQCLFSPIFLYISVGFIGLLKSGDLREVGELIDQELAGILVADIKLCTLVQFVNFYFMPLHFQVAEKNKKR